MRGRLLHSPPVDLRALVARPWDASGGVEGGGGRPGRGLRRSGGPSGPSAGFRHPDSSGAGSLDRSSIRKISLSEFGTENGRIRLLCKVSRPRTQVPVKTSRRKIPYRNKTDGGLSSGGHDLRPTSF
ncbi:uncharacterized protein [Centruroides vittatus]|uniref:uncharacterized protein n=1 Tax=Centruroides vittatus TaxID=120091 RepID=UPI00350ED5A5